MDADYDGSGNRCQPDPKSIVNNWRCRIQGWLLPPICVLCGSVSATDAGVCRDCRADLPRPWTVCDRCGVPLATNTLCGRCLGAPPVFDRVYCPFVYEEPVVHLIHSLKFNRKLHLARTLGELLAGHIAACSADAPEILVPVPLHPSRLRERGFNQALELARPVSRRLGIPFDVRICTRVRATPAQSALSAAERRRNVRGTFSVATTGARHVAIIDDVMTTGATVGELARTLKRSGIARVDVWVCARATPGR